MKVKRLKEILAKIERIAIERAYKLYYGKELDYKAHLEEIRKEKAGEYWDKPVKDKIKQLIDLIEQENEKGFTNVIEKVYDFDDLKMRDQEHILDQTAKHFKSMGLKVKTYVDSIYYVIEIKWK